MRERSKSIDILRAFLPLMVIVLHCSEGSGLSIYDGVESVIRVCMCRIGQTAVPMFFLISGYLFFQDMTSWKWSIYKNKVKRRVLTLLVPYLLWIIISFCMQFIYGALKTDSSFSLSSLYDFFLSSGGFRIFWDMPVRGYSMSIFGYAIPFNAPINPPLWFIRDLLVLVVLSPVVWLFFNVAKTYGLLLLSVAFICNIGIPFSGFSLTGLFFFSLGAYFSRYSFDCLFLVRKNIIVVICTFTLFILSLFEESITCSALALIVHNLYLIFAVILLVLLCNHGVLAGSHHDFSFLSGSSFFVYAFHHPLVIDFSNFLLWHLIPINTSFVFILKVFLRPLVTWGICLGFFIVIKKLAPRTMNVLIGYRNQPITKKVG